MGRFTSLVRELISLFPQAEAIELTVRTSPADEKRVHDELTEDSYMVDTSGKKARLPFIRGTKYTLMGGMVIIKFKRNGS